MNKLAYPVIFEKDSDGYFVTIPDLGVNTQGDTLADAINMARDLISLYILDKTEDGKTFIKPNTNNFTLPKNAIVSYVDVNIDIYSKKFGTKTVKKNCTIPAWLNAKAEEMNINFSKTLQDVLIKKVSV